MLCVEGVSDCGTSDQVCINIDFINIPDVPVLTGPEDLCQGTDAVFEVMPDPTVDTYIWDVFGGDIIDGDGTEMITVSWNDPVGGDVCVSAMNDCGESDPDCLIISTISPPTSNLDSTICNGVRFMYNGTEYGNGNFSGTEIFMTGSGCDSTVQVTVTELPLLTGVFDTTICNGVTLSLIHI